MIDAAYDSPAGRGAAELYLQRVPRSVHRDVEVAADWRPFPGWRLIAAYTYLDQFYIDYSEQLSAGALTRRCDRGGGKQDSRRVPERALLPPRI